MEENKYYTPEIEEFHVGFEFEIEDHGVWRKGDFHELDLYKRFDDYFLRVKHLDKEDIESFGFRQSQEDERWFDYKTEKYWMYKEGGLWNICDEESAVCFSGFIKNKSELKKLLKQLAII